MCEFMFFSMPDIKLYELKVSVRGHVSMMLICNAAGEALPPIYCVSGTQLKQNVLQGSAQGMLNEAISRSYTCFIVHV
jgi:hypothetical protein